EQNISSMGVKQVLYGTVSLNNQGSASIETVGRLANQRAYALEGDNDIVNVVDIVSPIATLGSPSVASRCALILPDWPYLGGTAWYSPSELTGSINVGQVSPDYTVEASNPPLGDLAFLT